MLASMTLPASREPTMGPPILRETIKEVWYNDFKDADTFYTKVSALKIMSFLDANSSPMQPLVKQKVRIDGKT